MFSRVRKIFGSQHSAPAQEPGTRRVTTPLLMQSHMTECAAAALGSVLGYFGRWAPLSELRDRCEISRDGSTAAGVARAARHYGLECSGWHGEIRHLRKLPLPLILFWEFNHFLILEGYDGNWFYLNDPALGRRKLSEEEFARGFTGVALRFKAGPDFRRGGVRFNVMQRLPLWLGGSWGTLAQLLVCGLLLALLALVTPALLAVFVDQALGGNEPWGGQLAGALALSALLVYGLTWLRQRWLQRLAVRISVVASNRALSQLLRLPVNFFNHRLTGELTARILSIDKIAKGLANHFAGLLIEIVMNAVFLVVMLAYNASLALVVLGLAVLNAVCTGLVTRLRIDKSHALRREQALLLGVGMLTMQRVDVMRMTAEDDSYFSRWGGHQARELAARQSFSELSHVNGALPGLFLALSNAAVLAIGAAQVMAGEMTLGILVGFYIVAGLFLAPIGRFVELADDRQEMDTDLQRLDDITDAREDPNLPQRQQATETIATLDGRLRLTGQLELRGITFGYSPGRPALLKDFSLVIKPGQRVAIVGPSGSGKSTVSRLVAGFYQPWAGEILFDGCPRREIPSEVMSRSLAMVDQHVTLFSGSLRENLTLWNPAVPDNDLVAAARDACIHDEILSRPLGYAAQVDENGGNFSGGQRQRLELARALAGNPTILVLDEATSALDAATEELIDDALRRRGVSSLIIAHRLSTVRDCDEIIVLDNGEVVQRGDHDELMADANGLYQRLVRAG